MKRYKDDSPINTVARIRNILSSLNISTDVKIFNSLDYFYSCRVYIKYKSLPPLYLGCNGKGMSKDLALASGYSELLERIQNGQLFDLNLIKNFTSNKLSYRSIYKDYRRIPVNTLQFIFPQYAIDKLRQSQIECYDALEFHNIINDDVVFLPTDIMFRICGTTGLCAGNTREEALVQGICEILERKALQTLYTQNVLYNSIEPNFFSKEIIDILDNIEAKYNVKYEIKDCTCIKGIPVIGLLLIDKTNSRYTFRLGCDPDPNIALERCVTEIFQGLSGTRNAFNDICFNKEINRKEEFFNSLSTGQGMFFRNIFTTNSYVKDIYFNPLNSNCERLQYITSLLKEHGYSLFVRDNSLFSYPSYAIFIPKLSELDQTFLDGELLSGQILDRIYRINSFSKTEFAALVKQVENIPHTSICLMPLHTPPVFINKYFLLFILYERLGLRENSSQALRSYLSQRTNSDPINHKQLRIISDYVYLSSQGISSKDLEDIIAKCYGISLSYISSYLESISGLYGIDCPNCTSCKLETNCFAKDYIELFKLIYKI